MTVLLPPEGGSHAVIGEGRRFLASDLQAEAGGHRRSFVGFDRRRSGSFRLQAEEDA